MKLDKQFDYLFYDGFSCIGSRWRDLHIFRGRIANTVLFSELSEVQHIMMSRWIQGHGVALLAVLPRPVKAHHIHDVLCSQKIQPTRKS